MSLLYFNPHDVPPRPCWHCQSFDGMTPDGSAALCNAPRSCRVRSAPDRGCSGFKREPGSDDEPGPPAADSELQAPAGVQAAAPAVQWAP